MSTHTHVCQRTRMYRYLYPRTRANNLPLMGGVRRRRLPHQSLVSHHSLHSSTNLLGHCQFLANFNRASLLCTSPKPTPARAAASVLPLPEPTLEPQPTLTSVPLPEPTIEPEPTLTSNALLASRRCDARFQFLVRHVVCYEGDGVGRCLPQNLLRV
jgi:hypothetical protein